MSVRPLEAGVSLFRPLVTADLQMRLDIFLKTSRLILRRSLAQEFCDSGRVRVNGASAKPSKEVKVGDLIEIRRGEKRTSFRVLSLPARKQVSKDEASQLVEMVGGHPDG